MKAHLPRLRLEYVTAPLPPQPAERIPRQRPKTPRFVLDFKISEMILNCFKPENVGWGGSYVNRFRYPVHFGQFFLILKQFHDSPPPSSQRLRRDRTPTTTARREDTPPTAKDAQVCFRL